MSESSTLPSDSTSGLNSPSSKSRRLLIVGAVIVAIVAVVAFIASWVQTGRVRNSTTPMPMPMPMPASVRVHAR